MVLAEDSTVCLPRHVTMLHATSHASPPNKAHAATAMEFLPTSADFSSPKGVIIVNTLAAVVLSALAVRWWMRSSMKTDTKPSRVGTFEMSRKDFGDDPETRRDVSRTYAAGCILVMVDEEPPILLRPPAGLASGVDASAVEEHIGAFERALRDLQLPGYEASAFGRLLPMLTVNPALSALSAAGKMPMLKGHRFLIRAATATPAEGEETTAAAGGSLHCLTIGYVGAPPGQEKTADEVLIVGSPNLLERVTGDDPRAYALTYALRKAERKRLEEEMEVPGVAEVPNA